MTATARRTGGRKGERVTTLTLVLDQASGALRLTEADARTRLVGVSLLPDAAALMAEAQSTGRRLRLLITGEPGEAIAAGVSQLLPVEASGPLPVPDKTRAAHDSRRGLRLRAFRQLSKPRPRTVRTVGAENHLNELSVNCSIAAIVEAMSAGVSLASFFASRRAQRA